MAVPLRPDHEHVWSAQLKGWNQDGTLVIKECSICKARALMKADKNDA